MTMPQLLPGDVLLYRGGGFWSWAIRVKTWADVSHVEVYVGEEQSVASRDGVGVRRFPLRTTGFYAVLRPRLPFDSRAAVAWFETVNGQGYDWMGLVNFYLAKWRGRENGRQFCSEFATRFLRAGGVEPFTPEADADTIAPGEFLKSGAFTRVRLEATATA